MFARVGVESPEFVGVDSAQHSRREQSLEQAADAACAVPGGGDPDKRRAALRRDRDVVTALESMSDSVRTRPGSGSATFIR